MLYDPVKFLLVTYINNEDYACWFESMWCWYSDKYVILFDFKNYYYDHNLTH
jgi:hypothetical protein